ncbi:hypothetical protein KA405_04065 [Patescibacteria group bacterium]|nr:hypothetical protein [Patescibacteria group bacterium]
MEIFEEEIMGSNNKKILSKTSFFIIITGTKHLVLLLFFLLLYTMDKYFPNDDWKIIKVSSYTIALATMLNVFLLLYINLAQNNEEFKKKVRNGNFIFIFIIALFWFVVLSQLIF